jgi:hypothetical protein
MSGTSSTRRLTGLALFVATLALGASLTAGRAAPAPAAQTLAAQASPAPAERVDFNWQIRPILAENCLLCHGPDEKNRRANLRLDTAQGAYAALRRADIHAVVPRQPEASELIRRVTAGNAALRMPPASTKKTLTVEQVDLLRRWIAQGAEYTPHWALITPTLPAVPAAARGPAAAFALRASAPKETGPHVIDRFITQRLAREQLALSSPADRETLINRVSLTLTGLPPTLAEVDAFVADTSPNAYEKVVDRLLASAAYGEHMGNHWLNLARYAESDGFLDDLHDRLFWPYRDWVIASLNRNMPFDQFATWQLAGDLLPSHTKEQRLATAFLRVGRRTTENGAIDEEYRVEYVVDRTTTVGTAFLGLTTGCARCHDHKYDPIPTKDFYALSGFFNSIDEPGFYNFGRNGVAGGPTLPWADAATEAQIAKARGVIGQREAEYAAARAAARTQAVAAAATLLRDRSRLAALTQQSIDAGLQAYYPLDDTAPIPDDQLPRSRPARRRPGPAPLAPATLGLGGPPPSAPPGAAAPQVARVGGPPARLPIDMIRADIVFSPGAGGAPPAVLQSPILEDGIKGKAFHVSDANRGILGNAVGDFDRTDPFSLDLWLKAARVYADATVITHRESDDVGPAGYVLFLDGNRLRFELQHSRAGNGVRVITKQAVAVNRWTHVTVTYDGSSKARGVALYIDGSRAETEITRDSLTMSAAPNGSGIFDEFLGLSFGKRFRLNSMKDGAIDEIRVFHAELGPLEVASLHATATGAAPPQPRREDVINLLIAKTDRVAAALAALTDAREADNQLVSVVPQIMVMEDMPSPRPTYVLVRGQYAEHGERVTPRGLDTVLPWNETWPRNRLGLARWLFDPKHPLTSRVFVNRVWQMHFGRGLVETSEDFGVQGAIPSHPELLDYLAVTFRTSGWDIKRLHRQIVMSATYQQSSNATEEQSTRDPRNVLLARFPRVRLPAELVRDNALAASGLLVRQVGGPSVHPYQPPGIWSGFNTYTYPVADRVPADEHHRRSLYSFIKRNAPHPALAAFDFPDRGMSTARRQTSNTPLQALVLLNDPQYLEAYRTLAAGVLRAEPSADGQITQVFRLATRRRPRADEMATLRTYYDDQIAHYARDADAARALVKVGVTPPDAGVDAGRLAALTNVTSVVMNTPDAYSLR